MKPVHVALFVGSNIVVHVSADGSARLPLMCDVPADADYLSPELQVYECDAFGCVARRAASTPAMGDGYVLSELRSLFHTMPADMFAAACKASQIAYWDSHSQYCPVCGTHTDMFLPNAKKCPSCGNEMFTIVTPAIIVLVRRADEILMVRARNFRGDHYGLVAGFVEPGETLEQCVEREVMEETGLRVCNVRYRASQPWPFPSGLMVAFEADYLGGDIVIQESELTDARFFGIDNLPSLPGEMSVARWLVEDWKRDQEK